MKSQEGGDNKNVDQQRLEAWSVLLGDKVGEIRKGFDYSLENLLNLPFEEFNISGRLLAQLSTLNVEVPLDLLSLIYKDDERLRKYTNTKSKHEICSFFLLLEPSLSKSFSPYWQDIANQNVVYVF